MTTLTITAKGQVTLKKSLLRHLGIEPSQKIEVDQLPHGKVVVRAAREEGNLADFIGCLSGEGASPLAIKEIAAQGWAGEN